MIALFLFLLFTAIVLKCSIELIKIINKNEQDNEKGSNSKE